VSHDGVVAPTLVFGRHDADRLVFGPLTVREQDRSDTGEVDFVAAPIELWVGGERLVRYGDRNGIEALALPNLRADLAELRRHGGGTAFFGDHDFPSMVALSVDSQGAVIAEANMASDDLWDIPLAPMHAAQLHAIDNVIASLEREFGPLTGYCACGRPPLTFKPPGTYPPRAR
jgi:hypothetical protein